MKARESGMPEEPLWESFFQPQEVLERLHFGRRCEQVVELGCGYGTFTIPAAHLCRGIVYALDIEPDLVKLTAAKAHAAGLSHVDARLCDFVQQGTGLPDGSIDYCMAFNILHLAEPVRLLQEAWRILRPGGLLGVLHWNHDPKTPRGPSMEIRPTPEQCHNWAIEAEFERASDLVNLPPYHYGLVLIRPNPT